MAREPIAADALPQNFFVPTGSTAIGVTGLPGQESLVLQYLSGGTVAIVPTAAGGYSAGFIIPTTPLPLILAGTFWLLASGATSLVQVLRLRSAGFEGATLGYNGTN